MHNLIIDTDPGHDDAIAIMLAIAFDEACSLRAITTVAGNQTIQKVTTNALKVLTLLGVRVPVASGASQPLERPLEVGAGVHGETGLDGPVLPEPEYSPESGGAQKLLYDTITRSDEPITLVPIGPETNIARLFREHPEVREKIERISLMGGALGAGNITMSAEFNIYTDPEAAREVFSCEVPIVMSGLDVTHRAHITFAEVDELSRRGTVSSTVARMLGFYGKYYRSIGMPGPALHDPCSVAYLIRPEIFRYHDYYVDVETRGELTRGMTVADRREQSDRTPNVRVLVDVDREAFVSLLFEGLDRLDRRVDRS